MSDGLSLEVTCVRDGFECSTVQLMNMQCLSVQRLEASAYVFDRSCYMRRRGGVIRAVRQNQQFVVV